VHEGSFREFPGATAVAQFDKVHPKGKFAQWPCTPANGTGLQASSFDLGIEEAVDEAMTNGGLQDFVARYTRLPGRSPFVD
jgi:hypothetical protein